MILMVGPNRKQRRKKVVIPNREAGRRRSTGSPPVNVGRKDEAVRPPDLGKPVASSLPRETGEQGVTEKKVLVVDEKNISPIGVASSHVAIPTLASEIVGVRAPNYSPTEVKPSHVDTFTSPSEIQDSAPESAPSDLEKSVQDLAKLVMKLTKGLEEGVIPRIESLEKAMLELPEQLKGSFTKQSELLKGYVDQKLGIQASDALAHPAGSTTATARPKSLFQEAFDWVRSEVDKSGGLSKVFGGTSSSTTAELDAEIAQLQRIKMGQDKIGYRNWLKESVAKGPALPPGTPPTVEHV